MPHYQSHGMVPPKRFRRVRRPNGRIFYEHIMTAEGFEAESSILYRLSQPARILHTEIGRAEPPRFADTVGNMLFQVERVQAGGDFLSARNQVLVSDEVVFSIAKPDKPMTDFYRNAWCDELITVVEGSGTMRSVFGEIRYEALDLILVPRGDTVQWTPDPGPQVLAVVESRSPMGVPPKFLKSNGQFRDDAPYHERDIRVPKLVDPIEEAGEYTLFVKTGDQTNRLVVDRHPFDVAGWDGYYYPYAISMRDYEPLTGSIHLQPDQYMAFLSKQTMVALITPRRLPEHPDTTPSQAYHQNIDFDEILYRFSGSTGATELGGGTFTLHQKGYDHGPKPGFEDLPRREAQDAWALMVDTTAHLRPTAASTKVMDDRYQRMYLEGKSARESAQIPNR